MGHCTCIGARNNDWHMGTSKKRLPLAQLTPPYSGPAQKCMQTDTKNTQKGGPNSGWRMPHAAGGHSTLLVTPAARAFESWPHCGAHTLFFEAFQLSMAPPPQFLICAFDSQASHSSPQFLYVTKYSFRLVPCPPHLRSSSTASISYCTPPSGSGPGMGPPGHTLW